MRIYALKNNEESKSASGGAFPTIVSAIARLYPNDRISVFGATFNEEFKVVHSRVVLPQSIDAFKGSKYVYSSVSGIYEMVEKDITNGYIVVFSGTPCQCDGLKKYLVGKKISLEGMVLIDIICHGTFLYIGMNMLNGFRISLMPNYMIFHLDINKRNGKGIQLRHPLLQKRIHIR